MLHLVLNLLTQYERMNVRFYENKQLTTHVFLRLLSICLRFCLSGVSVCLRINSEIN